VQPPLKKVQPVSSHALPRTRDTSSTATVHHTHNTLNNKVIFVFGFGRFS
jgi:hypothetical protein